ncbi:MAG: DUF4180 domain-containing protein [Burkholderiaceae bacterium]|jgi:hypothetical protein|nr:DUF4180 domain-containing protein [Burkholderiaceae bacterium]
MDTTTPEQAEPGLLHFLPPAGFALRESEVLDMVAAARAQEAAWVAIDAHALPDDFFRLDSGLAGMALQKLVNYGVRLAVVGDISPWLARSQALSAFVREANRGRNTWFVADRDALRHRLQVLAGQAGQ